MHIYMCNIYMCIHPQGKKESNKCLLFLSAMNQFVMQHSKFAKEQCQLYKLDYVLVNQDIRIPGIDYSSKQWQKLVLTALNFSMGPRTSHRPQLYGQPSGCPSPAFGGGGQQGKCCLFSS